MSAANLLSWYVGHGLALETRGGSFEVLAKYDGSITRLINNVVVISFDPNSRTAQRLDSLYMQFEGKLRVLNQLANDEDKAVYRSHWWALKNELKG